MKNTIRTVQGKSLDMAELILKNEKTRAMGNMNVDASGNDITEASHNANNTVASRTRRANKNYRRQINKKVFDLPVNSSKEEAIKEVNDIVTKYISDVKNVNEIEGINTITKELPKSVKEPINEPKKVVKHNVKANTTISDELLQEVLNRKTTGGLAKALAKKKTVKKEKIKSPRDQLRNIDGVKKI